MKLSGNAVEGCTAEIKKPDPESEEDAKALQRGLFQSVGTQQQFSGSQFAQTVMVKCSDAPT